MVATDKNFDVIIIGGGVIGTAVAYNLSKLKLKIALLEKEMELAFGTTKANSGIVHAGFHSKPGTLKASMCVKGSLMYPKLCQDLDVPYKQNGVLMVAFNSEQLPELNVFYNQGRLNGLTDLKILTRDELLKKEPNLQDEVIAGLFAPTGGVVSPFELAINLGESAKLNGVEVVLDSPLLKMEDRKNHLLITTKDNHYTAKIVINCAGLYADNIARMLGDDSFSIIPRKGEEYLLDKRVGNLINSTIFPLPTPNSKGMLVIPTVHGNLMLGPTAIEMDKRDEFTTTALGLKTIYDFTKNLVKGLEKRDLIASFAGIRAASDRGDFIIEFSKTNPRLLNIAGIESPGLTAAPAIGEKILEMVKARLNEEGMSVGLNPSYNPVLPKKLHLRDLKGPELEKAIQQDNRFAHVICRCELVSEAEIVAAIKSGAKTLDGIKLRTRAGMGRCQGGFCTPKILKIMSRELGIPVSELTKRGGDSVLVPYTAKELI